ncbi:MAG TPA: glycosyltransferase [Acidobacteriaceae bacterium]|nr:glycosyltransferase [Acidobacteriaceae bacterium]
MKTTAAPLLTIGMPVYNAMRWLPEAIESLLMQTVSSFEIVAVVDGGSDGSLDYLRSMRDPRLRVLTQPNLGVTATLNRILREARTPWLVRQDADDVSYPRRIEKLLEAIAQRPDAGLIYSFAKYHPRERCAGRFRCSRGTPEELRGLVERGFLLSICHSTVALNIAKALEAGGYRMDLHAEDADLWWRMARQWEVWCIPEPLVGFRQSGTSVSTRHLEEQELAGLYVQYLLLSELWHRAPRPLEEIAESLLGMLRPAAIHAKEGLRRWNMERAAGRRLRGAGALARAVWASPGYVWRRLRDELGRAGIANGVPPEWFLERKELLWR